MRVFANLFLIMYLADGGFSLVDELVPLISPLESFTPLRSLLAETVILMAAAVYLCLGIDGRLPKRILIPQILLVVICPFFGWLYPPLAEMRMFGVMAASAQIALGMLPLYFFRKDGAPCLTLPPEMFAAPFFRWKNSLAFVAVNLLIAPCVLLLLTLFAVNEYMVDHTAGFMRVDPGGVRMVERVYRQDKRTIRLAAMMHIGEREYYDGMAASIGKGRSIVLAEGVSDDEQLLAGGIDYGKMAGYLGLASQKEMQLKGRLIEPADLELPRSNSRSAADGRPAGGVDIIRADVDISDFRPETVLLLDTLGKKLEESDSFVNGFLELNSWGEKNMTPEKYEIITDDILHRRNMEVIRYLEKALKHYDTVVIPWGALHMKEIEAEVLKRGFKLQEERERLCIDFRKLLRGGGESRPSGRLTNIVDGDGNSGRG